MADDDPVRLRGHHLLCLLTYKGLGYSPAFVAGMTATAARLVDGATVEIVEGPDDICEPLCRTEPNPHCQETTVPERDRRALALIAKVLGRAFNTGDRFVFDAALRARLRAAYRDGAFGPACTLCEWQPLCREIAASGYPDTLFRAPDEPS